MNDDVRPVDLGPGRDATIQAGASGSVRLQLQAMGTTGHTWSLTFDDPTLAEVRSCATTDGSGGDSMAGGPWQAFDIDIASSRAAEATLELASPWRSEPARTFRLRFVPSDGEPQLIDDPTRVDASVSATTSVVGDVDFVGDPVDTVHRDVRFATDPSRTSAFLEEVFDRQSEVLRLEKRGRLWEAVALARELERDPGGGTGRTIAIVDSGFDLSIKRLKDAAHPESIVHAHNVRRRLFHGTVVALLINEIAPNASLLLLDVRRTIQLTDGGIADAIATARHVGADIINLSLEAHTTAKPARIPDLTALEVVEQDPAVIQQVATDWQAVTEPYSGERCSDACPICDELALLPDATVVIAAMGNNARPTCPACFRASIGVAFQNEAVLEIAGQIRTVYWSPRSTEAQRFIEFGVTGLPGFGGTSFAAPLVAAFAALLDDPTDVVEMSRLPRRLAPVAWRAHVLERAGTASPRAVRAHQDLLASFAELCPESHRHWDGDQRACAACTLFMVDFYDYNTVFRLAIRHDEALAVAVLAQAVAPFTASTNRNLAVALKAAASNESAPARRSSMLEDADRARREADRIDPPG